MAFPAFHWLILFLLMAVGSNTAGNKNIIYFNETSMTVPESNGQVEICVTAAGFDGDGIASGRLVTTNSVRSASDKSVYNLNHVFFMLKDKIHTKCTNATVFDNKIVDFGKVYYISMILSPNSFVVKNNQTLQINITNDDTARINFTTTLKTVSENVGHVEVCMMKENRVVIPLNVIVSVTAMSDTASAPEDYQPLQYSIVSFEANETIAKNCTYLNIKDDHVTERNEKFYVKLESSDPLITLKENQSTMTIIILDDDKVTAQFEEQYNREVEETLEEGKIELVCVINGTSSIPLHVGFVIDNFISTVIEGSDFTLQNKTLTFPPGTTRKTLTINIKRDGLAESTEILLVKMVSLDDRFVVIGRNDTAKIKIHDKFDQENDKARQEREEKQHQIFILMVVAAVFVAILCVISIVLCICLIKFVKK